MAIKVELLCNCFNCKEYAKTPYGPFCKATINTEDPTEDPAGYWLKLNRPYSKTDLQLCREDSDDCPCWLQGVEILPENSWYKRQR